MAISGGEGETSATAHWGGGGGGIRVLLAKDGGDTEKCSGGGQSGGRILRRKLKGGRGPIGRLVVGRSIDFPAGQEGRPPRTPGL